MTVTWFPNGRFEEMLGGQSLVAVVIDENGEVLKRCTPKMLAAIPPVCLQHAETVARRALAEPKLLSPDVPQLGRMETAAVAMDNDGSTFVIGLCHL